MAITINSSVFSLRAQRKLRDTQGTLSETFRRLSSGIRVGVAADDPGRLGISVLAEAKQRSLRQSVRNLNDGISLSQTLEGGLSQLEAALQRLRELAVQASSETLSQQDRKALQSETNQIISHMDKVVEQTSFNGINLLDGSAQSVEIFSETSQGTQAINLDLVKVSPTETGRKAKYSSQRRGVYLSDLSDGGLKINGVSIRGTDDTDDPLSFCYESGSAIAKANAINAQSEHTGVTARAAQNVITANRVITAFTLDPTNYFAINGVKIAGMHITDSDADGSLRHAINSISEETGVIADLDSQGQLVLTAEDGRNIQIHYSNMFTLIAVGLADTSGDEINLQGQVLKSSVFPVDLFGSIQSVQSNFHSYGGNVTIGGEFDPGRDHVDYVAQVIKDGGYGTAEFRIARELGSETTAAEDFAFLDVNGPYATNNDANMEYFSNSPETVNNGVVGSISSTGTYNEAADRTYTITVTQEGSTDGTVKAVGQISSDVDGVIHAAVTLTNTITLGTALNQTGEFVTLTLGATPRGQSVGESGTAQPYSQAITQNAGAANGVKITGNYTSDVDMIKEVRVVDTGYTQGINKAQLQVFNSVNGGAATAQGAAFDISTGAPINIGDGLFIEFTPMERIFNLATGSTISNSGAAGSFDSNGLDVTLTSTTLDFVGERGDGTYSVEVSQAGKTGNAQYEVLFNGGVIAGPRVLNAGNVDVADGITFNIEASTPEIGSTTASVTASATDHYGAIGAYQAPDFEFGGAYTGNLNDTTVTVEVIQEGRVLGAAEATTGDAAVLRYTIAGTAAGPTITATTLARATTYTLGEGVDFTINNESAGTQVNIGGIDVGTSHNYGAGAILGYNGEVTLNLDQNAYDLPEDLTLRLSEINPVAVGSGSTAAQGKMQADLIDSTGAVVTGASFSVVSGAVNTITPGLTITFDSAGFSSIDFNRDNSTPLDDGTITLSGGATYNNALGDGDYKISFANAVTQNIVQISDGPNLVDDVAGADANVVENYSGLFGSQAVDITFEGTSANVTSVINGADDGTNLNVIGTYNGLSARERITVTYLGDTITPGSNGFGNDTFNVQPEAGAKYNGLSGDKRIDVTFTGDIAETINQGSFTGTVSILNTANHNRNDFTLSAVFTADNVLQLDNNGTINVFNLLDGSNNINLASIGLAEVDLKVDIANLFDETTEAFSIDFDTTQSVSITDSINTEANVDISSGQINLGEARFSTIFAGGDPGFDLDVDLSTNGTPNTMTIDLRGPQAEVKTGFGAGRTTVDISNGVIDFSDPTFNGFFTGGDPDIQLQITNPELSENDVWLIDLDTLGTVTLSSAHGTVNNIVLTNTPGSTLELDFDALNNADKTTIFSNSFDPNNAVDLRVRFSSDELQSDDTFRVNLDNTPTINVEDLALNNGGTDYIIGTSIGAHNFDLSNVLIPGLDPGFDLVIQDPIKGDDDVYFLSLRQSELTANNTDIAELNVKSLQENDQWTASLVADTLEVGTKYDLNVTAPHLNNGHTYEIEENVGTLKVGEALTVGQINSAFEPTVYTVDSSVAITDGVELDFSTNGTFEVGDEIRFQARGYRGDYSVFGQYTDPAFPTTFEVEVITTGDVDGGALLKATRLDTNQVIANNVSAVSVADVGNIGGPGYLELGVFMQFDANNGAGEAHRLYKGDKFYIDVVGSLSQNFASQIILESEDNIEIEYTDVNVDNEVGRLLYVGDAADVNSPGTLTTLKSATLGINTEFSIAKLDLSTQVNAEEGLRIIDEAVEKISNARIKTGAVQNRMNREITSLEESLFQSERFQSRITDADFAIEVARQTKALIIQQSSTQILSQINNFGQYGLQLVQSLTE